MPRQQAAHDPYGGLEHLWLCIAVEGDPADDLADRVLESRRVVQDDESVKDINQSDGEVARDIISGKVTPANKFSLASVRAMYILYARIEPVGSAPCT